MRILMYHGVTDRPLPTWTQLPVERFAEQMEHLRRHYRVVSLDEAVEGLRCGRALPDHAVVLTFDDGFRNNLTAAYPILRTHGFPAIIYLATAFLDRDPRFGGLLWPDRLFLLLESAPEGELDLSAWGLGRFPLRGDPDRRRAREVLSAALKREDPARKNAVLEAIAAQVGEVRGDLAQALEGLSWDEARDLDAQGLVRFGAHTMHHDILTRLPPEAVEEEIRGSRERIESELGKEIRHFAYPNGTRADFDAAVREAASRHFVSAVTTIDGLAGPQGDLFALPRIPIGRDATAAEFTLRLCGLWPGRER